VADQLTLVWRLRAEEEQMGFWDWLDKRAAADVDVSVAQVDDGDLHLDMIMEEADQLSARKEERERLSAVEDEPVEE
jgi:hypothetical protein